MGLNDSNSIIAGVEFFSVCNDEQIKLLAFASEREFFSAGEVIADENKGVSGAYIINSGTIIVSEKSEIGGEPFHVSGPGALVGGQSLLLNKNLPLKIIAKDDVDSLFIPNKAFQKLLQQYPDLAARVAKKIEQNLDNFLQAINQLR